MKKLIAMLLALAMVFALCACGADSKDDGDKTEDTTAPSSEATEPSSEATEPSSEATEPSSEATEPSSEATEPSSEPPLEPDHVVCYKGLHVHLSGGATSGDESDTGLYFTYNGVEYFIGTESAQDLGTDAQDSESLAQWVGTVFEEQGAVTTGVRNGVGYVICEDEEGYKMIGGCYILGDTLWGVCTTVEDGDLDLILDVVTSGVIDESYVPDEPSDPTEPSFEDPGVGDPVAYMFAGLEVTLDNLFEPAYVDDTMASYTNGKIYAEIVFEPLSNWDNAFSDPESFAAFFAEMLEEDPSVIQTNNAVPYLAMELPDFGEYAVYGFYVMNNACWRVVAMSPDAADMERMIEMATSGVIYMSEIPEIKENELPEPSQDISFAGLTVHLDDVGTPIMVFDQSLTFTYGNYGYDIVVDTVENVGVALEDSAALAEYLRGEYESMWGSVSVEVRDGVSYVLCQDEDGFTSVTGCYLNGDTVWMVSGMDYYEDLDMAIDVVVSGTIDEM